MRLHKFYLLSFVFIFHFCQTAQEKKDALPESPASSEITGNKILDEFFAQEAGEEEALRVFVTSDDYVLKQVGFDNSMSFETDTAGKNAMSEEISGYDMIDLFIEAVYKVEIYKDSGLISHIRPVKPSKISEINKIIADDITRLKFKFVDSEKIEPLSFKIKYGIQLRNKKSRDEIRKILQENVR